MSDDRLSGSGARARPKDHRAGRLLVRANTLWSVMKASNGLAGPGSFAVLFDHQGIRIGHSYSDISYPTPAAGSTSPFWRRLWRKSVSGKHRTLRRMSGHSRPNLTARGGFAG